MCGHSWLCYPCSTQLFMLYQFLQLQYRAVILFLAVAHLCLALNDFLALGFDFLIFMLGSPKRIVLMLPVLGFFTYTLNFLGPPLVLMGLLSGPFFLAAINLLTVTLHFVFAFRFFCLLWFFSFSFLWVWFFTVCHFVSPVVGYCATADITVVLHPGPSALNRP